jgi:hypothetical protein
MAYRHDIPRFLLSGKLFHEVITDKVINATCNVRYNVHEGEIVGWECMSLCGMAKVISVKDVGDESFVELKRIHG